MFKCVALLKRKPGFSRDLFIEYYEQKHAVLIQTLLPDILFYRRNYLREDGAFISPGAAPVDFDVITEIGFADRAGYDAFVAAAADPAVAKQIAEDEANLFDRDATRMFVVDIREGGAAELAATATAVLD